MKEITQKDKALVAATMLRQQIERLEAGQASPIGILSMRSALAELKHIRFRIEQLPDEAAVEVGSEVAQSEE